MYILQMTLSYCLAVLLVLNIYLFIKLGAYKDLYDQAKKDWFAIAKKRNEAEKLASDYFKSIKSALRKFNK